MGSCCSNDVADPKHQGNNNKENEGLKAQSPAGIKGVTSPGKNTADGGEGGDTNDASGGGNINKGGPNAGTAGADGSITTGADGAGGTGDSKKGASDSNAANLKGGAGGKDGTGAVNLPLTPASPSGGGGSLVPQEFAYVRDIVGDFSKIDQSLRRRVRIEPEYVLWDIASGKITDVGAGGFGSPMGIGSTGTSPSAVSGAANFTAYNANSPGTGNVSGSSSPNQNALLRIAPPGHELVEEGNILVLPPNASSIPKPFSYLLRKGPMVSHDESRILRLAVDVASRLLKANAKLGSSWYFRQPCVILYDEAVPNAEAQQQKYTGLPTIAAADRSQDLSGTHALVSTIELLLNDCMRFIVQSDIWKQTQEDEDGDMFGDDNMSGGHNVHDKKTSSNSERASSYAAASGATAGTPQQQACTMDNIVDILANKVFSTNTLWSSVSEPGTSSSSSTRNETANATNTGANTGGGNNPDNAGTGANTQNAAGGKGSSPSSSGSKSSGTTTGATFGATFIPGSSMNLIRETLGTNVLSLHSRYGTAVQTAVRLLFLSIGGTEFAWSPNEHGVPPLPSFDTLVSLLLKRCGPILKARTINRNKLRSEITKWMTLLVFLGLVPEIWEYQFQNCTTSSNSNDNNMNNMNDASPFIGGSIFSSPFAQIPVFLLSPIATSQLMLIEFALRSANVDKSPLAVKSRSTALPELLNTLTHQHTVPEDLSELRPDRPVSPFNAYRFVDAPTVPTKCGLALTSSKKQLPYSYPPLKGASSSTSAAAGTTHGTSGNPTSPSPNTNNIVANQSPAIGSDLDFAVVPSPADFEVIPNASVAAFFETATKPFFGTDSRFGVRHPPPLQLHNMFKSINLEYCAVHIQTEPDFDPMFSGREYQEDNNVVVGVGGDDGAGGGPGSVSEKLVPTRLVLESPSDAKLSCVQITSVDEGDVLYLDNESYVIQQRELRSLPAGGAGGDNNINNMNEGDGDAGSMPHAVFGTTNTTTTNANVPGAPINPDQCNVVVIHLRHPFEAPPFAAKRETLESSQKCEVRLMSTRCLFTAPSVDYATFVVSNQLQGLAENAGGGGGGERIDNGSQNYLDNDDTGGMSSLIQNTGAGGGGTQEGGGDGGVGVRSADDVLRQLQSAYLLGWLIGSAIASGVCLTVPLPALLFRVLKTFVVQRDLPATGGTGGSNAQQNVTSPVGDQGAVGSPMISGVASSNGEDDSTFHCLFQASEADVLEMMPRISAVVDDIRRLSTMRFIDLVRMEGLGSIMTKDEYITSIIAEPIVFPLTSFPIYEATFTGLFDSGLRNSPLWLWSSPLTHQRVITSTCLEDDDRNAPDSDKREWDIRVGFMPFTPEAVALEERFSEIVERVIAHLSPLHKRELLRKSLGLLRPPAGSDHVFSVTVAIGSLEFEQGPSTSDFEEELHETPFVRPMDNILRVPNYLEALLFRPDGLYWTWFPEKRLPANSENRVAPEILENALTELTAKQSQELTEQATKLTASRTSAFLLPQSVPKGSPGADGDAGSGVGDADFASTPLEPM